MKMWGILPLYESKCGNPDMAFIGYIVFCQKDGT